MGGEKTNGITVTTDGISLVCVLQCSTVFYSVLLFDSREILSKICSIIPLRIVRCPLPEVLTHVLCA